MPSAGLSVVVPFVNGIDDLTGCLEALQGQDAPTPLEVLVVDRVGEPARSEIRRRFPNVGLIEAPSGATIPEMRALAIAAATRDFVAVIEDHVIVPPGWARALLDAQNGTEQVVGGSVENAATSTLTDWAAFLCEYSHCITPLQGGRVEWLTGNNVIYPRTLLLRYRHILDSGAWENQLHDALKGDGIPLVCRPEISVGHKMHYTVGLYLSQRYLYARSYAGARVRDASMPKRIGYGLAAFALPPLLYWRTVSRILSKRRHRSELVRSLPLLALFVVAWAAGEVVGYVAGAGDSLSKVR